MLQTFLKKKLEKIVVREHNFLMYAKKALKGLANDCFRTFSLFDGLMNMLNDLLFVVG